MEIYFNHKCVILLLPRGSHSIVGPARFAIKRIKHNQYLRAEGQKPKTFRIATFYAQKLSRQSARIRFSRQA